MIIFKKVRFKNLLSYGNSFTEIDLNKSNKTLLKAENGNGKSCIIDAITFSLYGKPFRKITKSGLINSINKSDLVTEIEFDVGSNQYKIIRGIKPNIFEIYCNENLVKQDAKVKDYQEQLERYILKMNYKSFTQVVILGAAKYTPFMQLTASDRRAIIEDLLDIQIFSTMNIIAKDKLTNLKNEIQDCKYNIELYKDRIDLQKQNIERTKKSSDEIVLGKKELIANSYSEIKSLQKTCHELLSEINDLQDKIKDKDSIDKKINKFNIFEDKIKTNITKYKHDNDFYHSNNNCPTCRQAICSEFKDNKININTSMINELISTKEKLTGDLNILKSRLKEILEIHKKINANNIELAKHNSSMSSAQKYITILTKELESINNTEIESGSDKLQELTLELNDYIKQYEECINEKEYYDFISLMLKDGGIKTQIIKQYLPVLNRYINQYLKQLDFFVNFNIDENFEEVIKSRHRDDFKYASFSEGEKMRLDLAILFAFRQLAKLKNSVNCNLLILDEVCDSSLDDTGTKHFMDLLASFGDSINAFVISHKTEQISDLFDATLHFEKVKNFSKMTVVK